MNSLIYAGTVVRFYTSTPFTTVAGSPADPDEVIFAYRVGNGPVTQFKYAGASSGEAVVVKDSTGTYHIDIDTTNQPGTWTISWVGLSANGSVQTRSETEVVISAPSVSVTP
jgi:hypothetical protein